MKIQLIRLPVVLAAFLLLTLALIASSFGSVASAHTARMLHDAPTYSMHGVWRFTFTHSDGSKSSVNYSFVDESNCIVDVKDDGTYGRNDSGGRCKYTISSSGRFTMCTNVDKITNDDGSVTCPDPLAYFSGYPTNYGEANGRIEYMPDHDTATWTATLIYDLADNTQPDGSLQANCDPTICPSNDEQTNDTSLNQIG